MKAFIILLGLSLLIAGCHCRPGGGARPDSSSTTENLVESPEGNEEDLPEISRSDGEGREAHCLKANISRKCRKGSGPIIFNDTE